MLSLCKIYMDHLYCSRKLRQIKILRKSTFPKKDQLCFWQMSWISASNNWRAIFHLSHHFWQFLSGIIQAGKNCCIIVNGIIAITIATNYLSSLRSGRISDFQFFFTFQWRIQDFSEGMSTPEGCTNPFLARYLLKNAWKLKNLDQEGVHLWCFPWFRHCILRSLGQYNFRSAPHWTNDKCIFVLF